MKLASELAEPTFGLASSPWEGHEVSAGYAVMGLPMSSGDILALRVLPRTDFGGYVSVWHRDVDGAWAQYVDRAPVEAGCPRVWGRALSHAAAASISVTWTGPNAVQVRMDQPALEWSFEIQRTMPLALLNALNGPLPLSTWRHRSLIAVREWAARLLGLGQVHLAGMSPSDQRVVVAMKRMYWVDRSTASLQGRDLGSPVTLDESPRIGGWPLPRRGVFAIGEAHVTITDPGEYERQRDAAVRRLHR